MSQIWNLPLESAQSLSTSRTDINDGFDTLRTHNVGTADPGTLVEGMIWINTTSNKVKGRTSSATFDLGDWGTSNLGHLRADGTIPLTANWSLGSFKLTSVTDPTAAQDAATKNYVDTTRVAKAGDTMTGTLSLVNGTAAAHAMRKDQIEGLTSFNTTTGHNHDDINSRLITKISANGGTVELGGTGSVVCTPGSGNQILLGNTNANTSVGCRGKFIFDVGSVVIASGIISYLTVISKVDTEGAAGTDDLDSITGGSDGALLHIYQASSGRTIVVRDNAVSGNIELRDGTNFSLNSLRKSITFIYRSDDSKWHEIARTA